ncbi:MAG: glutamyl-tRNA reductase [Nocardioidaceae bacterium]|nr:glutamyl-tRNA reductase [Nocardioidaceae bacterium]
MSILAVGISHHSAPVALLERLALDADGAAKLALEVGQTDHATEALVVSTCNRVEVYADVDRFHGSVEAISDLFASLVGAARDDVVPHLYVHYDDAAVAHLFALAAGLDSMVVGESQILGQVRAALQRGQEQGSVGPVLNGAFQQALRVGKRGHAETGIDQAGPSVVSAALDRVAALGVAVEGARAVVVGAGAMAGLAVAHLARRGAGEVVVVNRTPDRAARLAASVGGRSAGFHELTAELSAADVIVSCTGAAGVVVHAGQLGEPLARRSPANPLAIVDLALPHDVDPEVASAPAAVYVGLAALADDLANGAAAADVERVRAIVGEEVLAFLGARSSARATPTVVALRSMATDVVDAELTRLLARLPDLDDATAAEVELTVRRVAGKLLHAPTTRVKELTGPPAGMSYAEVLAELFSLRSGTVEAVTRVDLDPGPDVLPDGGETR